MMEDITNFNIPAVPANIPDTGKLSSWAKFIGVMNIIMGAFSCLGIITAAYGIPLIISGIRLLGAVEDLGKYSREGDAARLADTFSNLYKYFKLTGIAYIVMICFTVLGIILYGALFALILANLGNLQDFGNMPEYSLQFWNAIR